MRSNQESRGDTVTERDNMDGELEQIFRLFFDEVPSSFWNINTSRGDGDFRETVIVKTVSGNKYVIKLADNDFTFPDKIKVWQRTVREYIDLGYYCPRIYCDRNGSFPYAEYGGHRCAVYAEEFSPYASIEDRDTDEGEWDTAAYDKYRPDIWRMTARIAAKYLDYTGYPSGYCLFETFCPSDKTDEVLEEALKWREYTRTLPDGFQEQVQRIWEKWAENRAELEPLYKKLPTSVFQADLNSTNVLVDGNDRFVGIYDFNLCGKDVFLNYLMRENGGADFEKERNTICEMLRVASGYYHFSELEKEAALKLYRCLKPLWNGEERLRKLKGYDEIKALLDKTEHCLTADIDFRKYMEQKSYR